MIGQKEISEIYPPVFSFDFSPAPTKVKHRLPDPYFFHTRHYSFTPITEPLSKENIAFWISGTT